MAYSLLIEKYALKIKYLFLLPAILALLPVQEALAVNVGDKIPLCSLKKIDDDNGEINFSELKGQVMYVDFWASWCGPCAQSFPFMNQLGHAKKAQGLQIVAVNLDENIKDAQQFLDKIPAKFTIALDADQQCAKLFDVPAMPSSYLIDRKGVIRHIHLGFRPGETGELQAMIETLLTERE